MASKYEKDAKYRVEKSQKKIVVATAFFYYSSLLKCRTSKARVNVSLSIAGVDSGAPS